MRKPWNLISKATIFIFKNLFSKEVLAAAIAAGVLIWGYTWNSRKEQELERFKIKSAAYTNFLNELSRGAHPLVVEDLEKAQAALSSLYIYASDCVIRDINDSYEYENGLPSIGFSTIQKIKFILHSDINNPKECNNFLKWNDFPNIIGTKTNTP